MDPSRSYHGILQASPRIHQVSPFSLGSAPHAATILTIRGLQFQGNAPPEFVEHESLALQQKMKPRHLQMIAVGGSIGTGLFVGSGNALAVGGPAGLIIAWLIIGTFLLYTCPKAELTTRCHVDQCHSGSW
jgi:amino acid permease